MRAFLASMERPYSAIAVAHCSKKPVPVHERWVSSRSTIELDRLTPVLSQFTRWRTKRAWPPSWIRDNGERGTGDLPRLSVGTRIHPVAALQGIPLLVRRPTSAWPTIVLRPRRSTCQSGSQLRAAGRAERLLDRC